MKIKILALIMSLLLVCSCFVACSNGNDTEDTGTDAPATEAPGSDTAGEGNTPGEGEGNTPGEGEGNTPGEGEGNTPGEGEGNTPAQTPAEKYADLYAAGYVYYENEIIPVGSTDKYILDQDNFEKWYKLQLMAGNDLFGGFYILATDVTINEGNAADWKTTKPAKVYSPEANMWGFDGEFDGNGKTISGFCMIPNAAGDEYTIGMFGRLVGAAQVKNLRVVNSYLESRAATYTNAIGTIASRMEGNYTKITNCYSEAIIVSNIGATGGIAGYSNAYNTAITTDYNTISNCVFAGKIECAKFAGGIFGYIDAGGRLILKDCLNLGEIVCTGDTGSKFIGGIMSGCDFATTLIELSNCVNLSVNVPNAIMGDIYAGVPATFSCVMVTGVGQQNAAFDANDIPAEGITQKTYEEFLDANNKVFADWTYEEGYIPNPTTHTKISTSTVSTTPDA